MKCPHCLENFHAGERVDHSGSASGEIAVVDHEWDRRLGDQSLEFTVCPACSKLIVMVYPDDTERTIIVWPRHTGRSPVPAEVPPEFAKSYKEACLVLSDSSDASAALSRRCLQFILREKLGAEGGTLYKEIEWAIKSGNLPSSIVDLLDVPRKVGNRAVHPTLSDAGLIVDVEPWEAEWCLEVIEALYDHIFVLPARNQERLERLDLALESSAGDQQGAGTE